MNGLCECGCGGATSPSKTSRANKGYVQGAPQRFLPNHHTKNRPVKEYRHILVNGKLQKAHRLRAEAALGKPLPPGAVVHHADGSFDENAPLVICENQGYHLHLHYRTRIVKAGGNPNTDRICGRCKQVKPLTAFHKDKNRLFGRTDRCRECKNTTDAAAPAAPPEQSAASAPPANTSSTPR